MVLVIVLRRGINDHFQFISTTEASLFHRANRSPHFSLRTFGLAFQRRSSSLCVGVFVCEFL